MNLHFLLLAAALLVAPAVQAATDVDPFPSEQHQSQGGKVKLKNGSVKETAKSTGKEAGHGMANAGKEVGQGFKKGGKEAGDTAKAMWRDLKGLKKKKSED